MVSTLGRVKLDTPTGEAWLQRVSESYDVVVIDPYYRFLSRGDENNHADQRQMFDVLDRLKARGKAIVLVHHLRKPQGSDAGPAELRGAGLDGYADAIVILSRKKTPTMERFTLRYDLRNDEPQDDLELSPSGPLLEIAEPVVRKATAQDVARFIAEAGGRVEGRQAIVEGVGRATGAKEVTIRKAITDAETKGLLFSATRSGTRGQGKIYILKDAENQGGDEAEK